MSLNTTSTPVTALRAFTVGLMVTYAAIGAAAVRGVWDAAVLGLGLLCLLAVTLPVFIRKNYHLLEPATPLAALVGVCVNVKLLYILWFRGRSNNVDERLLLGQSTEVLIFGTCMVAIALLLFSLGYFVSVRIDLKWLFQPRRSDWSRKQVLLVLGAVLFVSACFLLLFIVSAGVSFGSAEELSQKRFAKQGTGSAGRIHSLLYYYYRLAGLAKLVFVVGLAWMVRTKRGVLSLEAAIVATAGLMSLLICMVVSNRAGVVLLLLDAGLIWFLVRGHVSLVKLTLLGAGAMALIMFLLFIRAGANHTFFELTEKTLAGRDLMDLSKTCHIVNAVPHTIEYRYGETLVGWLAAPVPRSIWRGKPMWAERGVYLTRYIYGDRLGFTGMPPGLIAELYWNLGWFGVIPGMFLCGVIWRAFFEGFRRNQNNLNAIVIYVLVVNRALLFTFGLDLGSGILKAALDVIPFLGIVLLVSRSPSTEAKSAHPVSDFGRKALAAN